MKMFVSVASLKLAKLQSGSIVETKGYYSKGDGGGARYLIAAPQSVDEYGDHTLANSNVALLQTEGVVNAKQYGAVGDGVADDRAAVSALLTSGLKNITTNEGDVYNIPSLLTISAQDGLTISGKGTFYTEDIDGCLLFDNCDKLTISGMRGKGNFTTAAWEALTPAERQVQKGFLQIDSSTAVRLSDIRTTELPRGISLLSSVNVSIRDTFHLGVFGVYAGPGTVTDANFGYAITILGGSDFGIFNPGSMECSGSVLVGLSAPRVKSYGGAAIECHDNGWYGSSCMEALCHGFSAINGGGIKMRGDNNIISECYGSGLPFIAFTMSGIPLDSAVDSQGAVGHGGGIFNCNADDCGALIRVDRHKETVDWLYMRDIQVVGNIGNNMTAASIVPVEILGIKNLSIKDNKINTFASTVAAYNIVGDGVGAELKGVEFCGNMADGGAKFIAVQNTHDSLFKANHFKNITDATVNVFINANDNMWEGTLSDDVSKIFDFRGHSGNKAYNNKFRVTKTYGTMEVDAINNEYNGLVDVATEVPLRVGQIVQYSDTNMYIAKGSTATTDWKLI